jgi:hypothetical protein
MRGPKNAKPGTLKRILLSNISSFGAAQLPSILSGVPGNYIEDVQINDVYFHQIGGGGEELASIDPPEKADQYLEPSMFGDLPATGLFVRHVRNLTVSSMEIATEKPDARTAFWLRDVVGADFFRLKMPRNAGKSQFYLQDDENFRVFGCRDLKDASLDRVEKQQL